MGKQLQTRKKPGELPNRKIVPARRPVLLRVESSPPTLAAARGPWELGFGLPRSAVAMLPRVVSAVARGLTRAPGCVRGAPARWTALGNEYRGFASVGRVMTATMEQTGGWTIVPSANIAPSRGWFCASGDLRGFHASALAEKARPQEEEEAIDEEDGTKQNSFRRGDGSHGETTATTDNPAAAALTHPHEFMVPVRAYYVGNVIDFHEMAKRLSSYPKEFFRECMVVRMTPRKGAGGNRGAGGLKGDFEEQLNVNESGGTDLDASWGRADLMSRYFVVYKYGSVVFFNMGRRERDECLKLARSFTKTPIAVPCTDDYRVMVRPGMEGWAEFAADHVVLKRLDLNNISVIGTVLAQTVALEHHELKVDNMIEIFSGLNKTTEETGEMDISKARLFKLVAENNNTLTELVTRMRLLGRSDTAWQYSQYDKVWSGLRADFELEDRFDHLDYKLNLIQTQSKFYLEILQNRKSDTLEWIIILLISMEICVSLYDMYSKLG